MARRFGFKPPLRKVLAANKAPLDFYGCAGDPNYGPEIEVADGLRERRAELQRSYDKALAALPKQRVPVVNRSAPEELESGVIAAISELLAVHPRVLIALRMNSGMASYEAKTGRYAPVWFHKWLRSPAKMKMPDFFGFCLRDVYHSEPEPRPFAIEAKRPSWSRPTNDREREQAAFLQFIRDSGGVAGFCRSADEAAALIAASV